MVLLVAMFTQRTLSLLRFRPSCCLPRCCVWHLRGFNPYHFDGRTYRRGGGWKVVEAFGHFLVGGNFAIGIVGSSFS